MEQILAFVSTKFTIGKVQLQDRKEAREIIKNLKGELDDCSEQLKESHSLEKFKACVLDKVENSMDFMWELIEEESEEDEETHLTPSSSSSSLPLRKFLIPLNLISGFFIGKKFCH